MIGEDNNFTGIYYNGPDGNSGNTPLRCDSCNEVVQAIGKPNDFMLECGCEEPPGWFIPGPDSEHIDGGAE